MTVPIVSPTATIHNGLLAAISKNEYDGLLPKMEKVDLPFGTIIYEAGAVIRHVYFPLSGVVSLLAVIDGRSTVDVGMIGKEGLAGISVPLGVTISAGRAIVTVGVTALRLAVSDFENAFAGDGQFRSVLLRFVRSMLVQVSRSAACYRFHTVERRLARLLLMINDRTESDELRITQEFVSKMLGVRREAVTRAAASLTGDGLISLNRMQTTIANRPGLEAAACECYRVICDEVKN